MPSEYSYQQLVHPHGPQLARVGVAPAADLHAGNPGLLLPDSARFPARPVRIGVGAAGLHRINRPAQLVLGVLVPDVAPLIRALGIVDVCGLPRVVIIVVLARVASVVVGADVMVARGPAVVTVLSRVRGIPPRRRRAAVAGRVAPGPHVAVRSVGAVAVVAGVTGM